MATGDIKLAYANSAAIAFTGTSLVSSSTFLAGRQSDAVDNTANLFQDYLLAGNFKLNNTTPTAGEIRIYVVALKDDTHWPDTFGASDAAVTVTAANILNNAAKLAAAIQTTATANLVCEFGPISVASLFGGVLPKKWAVYVAHNTVQAFNATGGFNLYQTGVYANVAA